MKAIIFNSGLGSRMGQMTCNKPKCMVQLYNGETILERQIRILSEFGIKEFIITTGPFKEQLVDITKKYDKLKFIFVENPDYKKTNYIVSMNNANNFLDDDVLLMHGDLVFNKNLINKIINDKRKSICLYNEEKILPEKDFKGRFQDNILKEVSINIFDDDCYAFQPLYKLSKTDIETWKNKVAEFVCNGIVNVYAENALNEITDKISICGMSYKNDYIEEIDNEDDYNRVSNEIRFFDYREQQIKITSSYGDCLKNILGKKEKIFIVSSRSFLNEISKNLKDYNITVFSDYSPNPKYEEIKKGIEIFKNKKYKTIISIGGGSTIDVAKCIKLFSTMKNELDFLENKYVYNNIRHIAIPTTAGTGSESTEIAVMYYKGEKFSVAHSSLLPNVAILDYKLLETLPDYQKKSTLLDSLCQGVESYWSKGATNESKVYAQKCISLILENYEKYLNNDSSSYENILLASNYSGKAINISRTTAAHAMSYKLSSLYRISHGHAVTLCIIPIWKLLIEKSKENIELNNILLQISKIFKTDDIREPINIFEKMLNKFKLPKIEIKEKDLNILVNSVNVERMKNSPIIFNAEEIETLYNNIK
jgi:alcohol dehydrogenase class IV/choline kinase